MNPIDDYIAAQDETVQPRLNAIRETIRTAIPDATEKISYQMPTYWKGRNIIHFAAFKNHIGLYPGGEAPVVFADKLKEMSVQREQLMLKKGELGMKEIQTHSLLKLIDAILEKEEEKTEGSEDGSCSDIGTFYGLTDRILQWGPLTEYDNELFKRFVEKVVVREKGLEVWFKAGLIVKA